MVKCFQAVQCRLGEGALWANQRLYWFDILSKQLHSCAEDASDHQVIALPEYFSAAALTNTDDLLLASETGLWRFNPITQALTKLIEIEADNPITRSNDGRADRHGGFWLGTMGKQAQSGAGALYRYYQGEVTCLYTGITISNSICFAPDGSKAYFADTALHTIYQWKLDTKGFPLGEPTVFIDLSAEQLSPDGSVIDSAGFLWNAQWGSSRVVRYSPLGQIDMVVGLPVTQPACPAFGGKDLKRLYVTSATVDLSTEALAHEPLAGSVFEVPLAVAGYPEGVVQL